MRGLRFWLCVSLALCPAIAMADAVTIVGYALSYITSGALAGAALTAVSWAVVVGAALSYSNYQARKAKQKARDAWNSSLEDRLVMLSTVDGQRSRIYGRARNVDGVVFKATHGPENETYTLVIALAGHEIDSVEAIYFNDQSVSVDVDGYVQSAPYARSDLISATATYTLGEGPFAVEMPHPVASATAVYQGIDLEVELPVTVAGAVVSGTVPYLNGAASTTVIISYQWSKSPSKARVRWFMGGPGQDLSTYLIEDGASDQITSADKFSGMAAMIVNLTFDPDAYPNGVPTVTALIRGAKVYDPRTGLTAWSQNPALCARDWALHKYGGALTADLVDDASVIAAANACDVSTFFTMPADVIQAPLYTCNTVARTDQDPWSTFNEMIEAMAGKAGWPGGKLRMRAGIYSAPVASITEDWLSGAEGIQIVPEPPTDEAINIYRPTICNAFPVDADGYFDMRTAYVSAPAPEVRAEAYITLDGRELPQETTLTAVTDVWHAQHVCGVLLREARNSLTVTLPCNLRAFQLELFDVVMVTLPRYGWAAKTFEVLGWKFSITGGVTLTLKETTASIFQVDAGFSLIDATPNTNLPNPFLVPAITGLTARSGTDQLLLQSDGTIITRILVTWDAINDAAVIEGGEIHIRYGLATLDESQWQTVVVEGYETQTYLTGVEDARFYLIKARAANKLVRGAWSEQFLHYVVGKTEPPPDVTGFTVFENIDGKRQYWWSYPTKPADLKGFIVKYAPALGATSWSGMIPLFEGAPMEESKELSEPQDGEYTFAIKAVDTSGNESLNAYFINILLDGNRAGISVYMRRPFELAWPGIKIDCYVDGYILDAASTSTWETVGQITPTVDTLLLDGFGNVILDEFGVALTEETSGETVQLWDAWRTWRGISKSPITYVDETIDTESVKTARLRAAAWASSDPVAECQYSVDGTTWTDWAPIPIDEITLRYVRVRWTVYGVDPQLRRAQIALYTST